MNSAASIFAKPTTWNREPASPGPKALQKRNASRKPWKRLKTISREPADFQLHENGPERWDAALSPAAILWAGVGKSDRTTPSKPP